MFVCYAAVSGWPPLCLCYDFSEVVLYELGPRCQSLGDLWKISMQLFLLFPCSFFFFIPLRMSVAHLNTTVAAAGDVYISICVCRSASATTLITHNRAFSSLISICAWRQHIGFLFSQSVWITIINKAPLYAHSPWVCLSLWDWILLHFITHMHNYFLIFKSHSAICWMIIIHLSSRTSAHGLRWWLQCKFRFQMNMHVNKTPKLKHLNLSVNFQLIQITQLLNEFPRRSGCLVDLNQEKWVVVKCIWCCVCQNLIKS